MIVVIFHLLENEWLAFLIENAFDLKLQNYLIPYVFAVKKEVLAVAAVVFVIYVRNCQILIVEYHLDVDLVVSRHWLVIRHDFVDVFKFCLSIFANFGDCGREPLDFVGYLLDVLGVPHSDCEV